VTELAQASTSEQRLAASRWCKVGVIAKHNDRLGRITKEPDSDADVKMRYKNGEESKYIKAVLVYPASSEEASSFGTGSNSLAEGSQPVTAEELQRALREAIGIGVPLWNSGDCAGCAAEYMRVVSQFQHADINLAQALRDCEGKSTGSARDGQGWILRRAMDECLQKIRAGTWEAAPPAPKVVILCSDFADHRADVQKHLARGLGVASATVPMIDLHESTPSSVTLAHYDVALVFTASWGAGMMRGHPSTSYERSAFGDRLADFVDGGGSVVMMYCNPPPQGRWELEDYCPMRHEGIKEAKPRQRASGGPLGGGASGPLWVIAGRDTAGAQVISRWEGIGPFLALSQPSGKGFTCMLNYFPPSVRDPS
jgi:hypothetical protein